MLNLYFYAAFPIKRCLTFTFIHCWLLRALNKRLLMGSVPKWRETFSLLCFNQILFLNVCISAGHTLWEGLAEFGTIVVPRVVFRSPVVVTGSPPSSNHYIRMQGRWWISLWMKMVRWCSIPFCLFFFLCNSSKTIFHPFLFSNHQPNIQLLFCSYNFCFFCVRF